MELLYKVKDRPSPLKTVLFAVQQVLAIIAGTITLPLIVGNGMSQSAALFGAAVGTLIYLICTKFKSPVFLGSSFTFLGSMSAAFAGAATASIGYIGVIIGAFLAGIVYLILSIIVKFTGTNWVEKVMPPVIVGPTVVIIALTLAPNAVMNLSLGATLADGSVSANPYICLACGLVTLIVVAICSVYGKKMVKLIPFVIGIGSGYLLAVILTLIGMGSNTPELMIVSFEPFKNISWVPEFAFLKAIKGFGDFTSANQFWSYFGLIAVSYVPIAFAVFSEHVADHKNISYIINTNLLEDPGLSRTLLGDGLGSMVGAFFGGCPNTTYGESVSCVAFSKNASIITIIVASFFAIIISFFGPFMTVASTIPPCVVGGISIALYGFIALSGFQMLKKVDLSNQKNIIVASTIFITGVGGLVVRINHVEFSPIACAFVSGILMNLLVNIKFKKKNDSDKSEAIIKPNEGEQK